MQEKISTLKALLIGGVVLAVLGYVAGIFLGKHYAMLASIVKYGMMGLGGLLVAGGIVWLIAGDTIKKKKNKEPEKPYEEQIKDYKAKLKLKEMETKVKLEEAKQKQIENKLRLQEAKIQAVKSQGKKGDMLDNLSGFVKQSKEFDNTVKEFNNSTKEKKLDDMSNMKGFF